MSELTNGLVENIVQTRHKKLFCYMFQITTYLWIIFIVHPGRRSLLLESVTIKFGSPRGGGPRTDMWGGGQGDEKNKYSLLGNVFYDSLL